ncbi:carbohydrate ABC transporter substrate-binding protein, CUT1 family [Sanguibacter gelidistatuariae]|uniref:Carbohydrate ABC transporter substrate-binding protein, CUT1 family n=1 Tax=Sanguibacter gelidistatuariae TaxID=1814289 RepID=A0A1G6VI25_9MICO|nr:extracellular solute-binding protein [Sanguibacter gelidistatuariae]SDD53184.1 carbohydrate ABC transporter substrate-binding protein, CUT1 family [Sanguibacter gelidistatuariae]
MMRSTVQKSLAVLTAGVVALSAAACGGGNGAAGAAGDGAASAWALTGGSETVFRASFDRWNEAHPDAKLTSEWFANDAFKEKIRTAVGSGNSPTLVFSWAGGTLADYVDNDAVADISDAVAPLLQNIIPSVAANGQIDGKTYAIPNNQSQPAILYYNQDLFDQVGVPVPTTYDELLTAVAKLSDAGIIPIALAGQSKWPELMYIQYLTDRIGGTEVFQSILDGEPDAWSDPAVAEALTKIQELVDAGAFGDSFGSVAADAGADTALVHTGKAAMVLQGSWVYPDFLNNAPDFVTSGTLGFANFPAVTTGTGDPANIVGNPANFWSVSASASVAEQKTATDFLKAETYSDEAIDEFLAVGAVPPVLGLEDKIAAADSPEYLSFVYSMVTDAPHFQLSWDQALPSDQAQQLLDNLSQIFLKQITPETFVDNMNATLG